MNWMNNFKERVKPLREQLSKWFWTVGDHHLYVNSAFALALIATDIASTFFGTPVFEGSLNLIFHVITLASILLITRHAIKLDHSSRRDSLTGLITRSYFMNRLEHKLRSREDKLILLLMDLDRFKFVNDTLGHAVGDQLLKLVSQKFMEVIRESDTVARLGGDEFAVIIDSHRSTLTDAILDHTIKEVCNRIEQSFDGQFVLNGYEVDVGVSIGVAVYPVHASTCHELLRCADVAMYTAKRSKTGYSIYDRSADSHTLEALMLVGSIRSALEQNQFMLFYQPQKYLRTNKVRAVEALIRWNHPTLGILSPDRFIPLCEQTGVMRDITEWVIKTAAAQAKEWKAHGLELEIAINISATDLVTPTFMPAVVEALDKFNLTPADLLLEITETAVVSDIEAAASVTSALSSIGIKLSIDDYGTGHTSLNYLKHLPISQIKIDKSFITHILENTDDYHIVQSTIQLAHELEYEVVAEGVESKAIQDLLVELDCDVVQGYFISRPLHSSKIDKSFLTRIESLT